VNASSPIAARHSSESAEWYTPPDLIEAARATMGAIDLDPASTARANDIVRAAKYFSKADDGLSKLWEGRVFLNPPGGLAEDNESRQRRWWFHLSSAWAHGFVDQAVFVCFSIELLQTTQAWPIPGPIPLDFPLCFPSSRVKYFQVKRRRLRAGKCPPHASCIVFLPPRERRNAGAAVRRFVDAFASHGRCLNLEARA